MKAMICLATLASVTIAGCAAIDLPDEPHRAPASATERSAKTAATDELSLVLELKDGSRIVGRIAPRNTPIEIRTESIGEVLIPLDHIGGIEFAGSNQQVMVSLQNGDKLRGAFAQAAFKLTTIFGKISVPVAQIKQLEVRLISKATMVKLLTADDWEQLPFPRDCD